MDDYEVALARRKQKIDDNQAEAEEKQEKQEEFDSRKKNYEEIEWIGLEKNEQTVVRFLGGSYLVRSKPTDQKIIRFSKIYNDAGKYKNVIWQLDPNVDDDFKDDPDWIMSKIKKEVLNYTYVAGSKVYNHEGTKSLEWVKGNGPWWNKFNSSKLVMSNVIGRSDEWCKVNKHSKALCKEIKYKEYEDGNTRSFPEIGVPEMLMLEVTYIVREFKSKAFDFMDMVIERFSEAPYYTVTVGDSPRGIRSNVRSQVSLEPLTVDEKLYELYDFDKLYRTTSYAQLLFHFKIAIAQVDSDCGTKFLEELQDLAVKEKAERESNGEVEEDQEVENSIEVTEELVTEVKSLVSEKELKAHFPKYDSMDSEEKQIMLTSVESIKDSVVTYKADSKCINCDCDKKIKLPEALVNCPDCAKEME